MCLVFTDQATLLRNIADLSLMGKKYEQAITYYTKWGDFTGEMDANVDLRIANAYYEMKQYAKVIAPADRAIEHSKTPKKRTVPDEVRFILRAETDEESD